MNDERVSATETRIPGLRTLLICHRGSELNRDVLARWMSSFSELVGILELDEDKSRVFNRIKFEYRRIGLLRMADVFAMRLYYRLFLRNEDTVRRNALLDPLRERLPPLSPDLPVLVQESPNSPEAEEFIRDLAPHMIVARCKRILTERIFTIPTHGTFVMHPGVCPEYRNAHGCFWALANDDLDNVGMTLLRADKGIDTGPVYGYYSYPFDEVNESHITVMERVVLDNLDAIRDKFGEIYAGEAETIDTTGRESGVWGQPWLTRYLRWKRKARQRHG